MADYIEVSRVINAWRKKDMSGRQEQYNKLWSKIEKLPHVYPLQEPTSREVLRTMEEDLSIYVDRSRWAGT
jgi:hypothetical protein